MGEGAAHACCLARVTEFWPWEEGVPGSPEGALYKGPYHPLGAAVCGVSSVRVLPVFSDIVSVQRQSFVQTCCMQHRRVMLDNELRSAQADQAFQWTKLLSTSVFSLVSMCIAQQ